MELKLINGDYVPDGKGGLCRQSGAQEVLSRSLLQLRLPLRLLADFRFKIFVITWKNFFV